jgi:hypothetical protein
VERSGDATPQIDREFRAAISSSSGDLEIGRILRQILERGLHRELGFESFEDYVVERLDLSPRTACRLVRLARASEAVATAFRGADHALPPSPSAKSLTRRDGAAPGVVRPEVDFWAPPGSRGSSAWSRGSSGCRSRGRTWIAWQPATRC